MTPSSPPYTTHHLVLLFRITVLTYCLCDAFPKLFEPKSKKVARLTAELAALEAERLSNLVVVFGYEVSCRRIICLEDEFIVPLHASSHTVISLTK
jgi:hypothetical protein